MLRKLMLATALSTISLALGATLKAAPPDHRLIAGANAEASLFAGWVVIHLTHGQWVSEFFYRYEDAYSQLQMYRSYGIPAHMRGV